MNGISDSQFSGDNISTDGTGSCKFKYHTITSTAVPLSIKKTTDSSQRFYKNVTCSPHNIAEKNADWVLNNHSLRLQRGKH